MGRNKLKMCRLDAETADSEMGRLEDTLSSEVVVVGRKPSL